MLTGWEEELMGFFLGFVYVQNNRKSMQRECSKYQCGETHKVCVAQSQKLQNKLGKPKISCQTHEKCIGSVSTKLALYGIFAFTTISESLNKACTG